MPDKQVNDLDLQRSMGRVEGRLDNVENELVEVKQGVSGMHEKLNSMLQMFTQIQAAEAKAQVADKTRAEMKGRLSKFGSRAIDIACSVAIAIAALKGMGK